MLRRDPLDDGVMDLFYIIPCAASFCLPSDANSDLILQHPSIHPLRFATMPSMPLPWMFPALVFYGLDLLMRMLHHRTKYAVLVPIGNKMAVASR